MSQIRVFPTLLSSVYENVSFLAIKIEEIFSTRFVTDSRDDNHLNPTQFDPIQLESRIIIWIAKWLNIEILKDVFKDKIGIMIQQDKYHFVPLFSKFKDSDICRMVRFANGIMSFKSFYGIS
jgi:hypothetical protein